MLVIIGLLSVIAWIWLIVIAFKNDAVVWGVVMIIFSPACILFGILNWNKASVPFILLLISIGLMFTLSPEQMMQVR